MVLTELGLCISLVVSVVAVVVVVVVVVVIVVVVVSITCSIGLLVVIIVVEVGICGSSVLVAGLVLYSISATVASSVVVTGDASRGLTFQ